MLQLPTLGVENSKNKANLSVNWNKDYDDARNKYRIGAEKKKPQIIYDYTQLKVIPNEQMVRNMDKDGYCRVMFQADIKTTSPQLFLAYSPSQVNRYYVRSLIIIANPEPLLVIENVPLTQGHTLYIHIGLSKKEKTTETEKPTVIDDLLNPQSSTKKEEMILNLSGLLGKTTCAFFEGQSILLTKAAIPIYTDLQNRNNAIFPDNIHGINLKYESKMYEIVTLNVLGNNPMPSEYKEGLVEGFEDEELYDCQTIDVGEDEVAYMQVPMYSEIIGSQVSINMLQGMFYMFFLALVILISVNLLPLFYIDMASISGDLDKTKITLIQLLIPTFIFIGGIGLLVDALVYKKSLAMTNAATLIMMFSILLYFCYFSMKVEQRVIKSAEILNSIRAIGTFDLNNSTNSNTILYMMAFVLFIIPIIPVLVINLGFQYPYNWMITMYCFSFWWAFWCIAYYCIRILGKKSSTNQAT